MEIRNFLTGTALGVAASCDAGRDAYGKLAVSMYRNMPADEE